MANQSHAGQAPLSRLTGQHKLELMDRKKDNSDQLRVYGRTAAGGAGGGVSVFKHTVLSSQSVNENIV